MRLRELGDPDALQFGPLRAEFEAALDLARSGTAFVDSAAANVANLALLPVSTVAIEEIDRYLAAGDLAGACERYDLARASSEIGLAQEAEIERTLATHWLADATLDDATLAAIARRYRWDDAVTTFPLGPEVVARLQARTAAVRKPGERFIGTWNWGAFCLTPFWLMAHGLTGRGLVMLFLGPVLLVIPFGVFALLGIAIRFGRIGNDLAVANRRFASEEQFVAVQNAWRNWGFAVLGAIVASIVALAALLIAGQR